jgi:hypothetical protein
MVDATVDDLPTVEVAIYERDQLKEAERAG